MNMSTQTPQSFTQNCGNFQLQVLVHILVILVWENQIFSVICQIVLVILDD